MIIKEFGISHTGPLTPAIHLAGMRVNSHNGPNGRYAKVSHTGQNCLAERKVLLYWVQDLNAKKISSAERLVIVKLFVRAKGHQIVSRGSHGSFEIIFNLNFEISRTGNSGNF